MTLVHQIQNLQWRLDALKRVVADMEHAIRRIQQEHAKQAGGAPTDD